MKNFTRITWQGLSGYCSLHWKERKKLFILFPPLIPAAVKSLAENISFLLSFVTISVYTRFQFMCKLFYNILLFFQATGQSYGTIQNLIANIRHFHRSFGFHPMWDHLYSFQLALLRCKRFLGSAPARKLPITPTLLLRMVSLLDPSNPLQAAMKALFLVSFVSCLRKSNLVVQSASVISLKVPLRSDFHVSSHGTFLNIRATKTIQFFQRA